MTKEVACALALLTLWVALLAYTIYAQLFSFSTSHFAGCHSREMSLFSFIWTIRREHQGDRHEIVYLGSLLSLEATQSSKFKNTDDVVTSRDAICFPIVGSVALFTVHTLYTYFGSGFVNAPLNFFTSMLGFMALGENLRRLLRVMGTPRWVMDAYIPLPFLRQFRLVVLAAYAFSFSLAAAFLYYKPYTLHNIFALVFAIQGIAIISLSRFAVGYILLAGLFIYDNFWVLGTNVMLSVAKQFEGPVKLILPTSLNPFRQSILGLGDIVLPGVFVALCLRFDHYLWTLKMQSKHKEDGTECIIKHGDFFDKPYFKASMLAYSLGLLGCVLTATFLRKPLPALLFICPMLAACHLIVAWCRGELTAMWRFDEDKLRMEALDAIKKQKST